MAIRRAIHSTKAARAVDEYFQDRAFMKRRRKENAEAYKPKKKSKAKRPRRVQRKVGTYVVETYENGRWGRNGVIVKTKAEANDLKQHWTSEGYRTRIRRRVLSAIKNLVRPNPIRPASKKAWMIIGKSDTGHKYYFDGESFQLKDNIVQTYKTKEAGERAMRGIHKRLPPAIYSIELSHA